MPGGPSGPGPKRPMGWHKGPAHKSTGGPQGTRGPTWAWPTRAQGGPQGPRGRAGTKTK